MLKTRIAIFTEQGQQLIVVPLDSSFDDRPRSQRLEALRSLQSYAIGLGLTDQVAIAWRVGGKLFFMAPDRWHPFLKTLEWDTIISNLSMVLTCHDEAAGPLSSTKAA